MSEVGKRYGRLVVVESAGTVGQRHAAWLCSCDCGQAHVVRGSSLRRGAVRSCGCRRKEGNGRLPLGVHARNIAVKGMKDGAKKRGLSWCLEDAFVDTAMAQPCHYCGAAPGNRIGFNWKRQRVHGGFIYNGLDRVDNARGYELDNVVPCCSPCNRAKGKMSRDEFLSFVERIHTHSGQIGVGASTRVEAA